MRKANSMRTTDAAAPRTPARTIALEYAEDASQLRPVPGKGAPYAPFVAAERPPQPESPRPPEVTLSPVSREEPPPPPPPAAAGEPTPRRPIFLPKLGEGLNVGPGCVTTPLATLRSPRGQLDLSAVSAPAPAADSSRATPLMSPKSLAVATARGSAARAVALLHASSLGASLAMDPRHVAAAAASGGDDADGSPNNKVTHFSSFAAASSDHSRRSRQMSSSGALLLSQSLAPTSRRAALEWRQQDTLTDRDILRGVPGDDLYPIRKPARDPRATMLLDGYIEDKVDREALAEQRALAALAAETQLRAKQLLQRKSEWLLTTAEETARCIDAASGGDGEDRAYVDDDAAGEAARLQAAIDALNALDATPLSPFATPDEKAAAAQRRVKVFLACEEAKERARFRAERWLEKIVVALSRDAFLRAIRQRSAAKTLQSVFTPVVTRRVLAWRSKAARACLTADRQRELASSEQQLRAPMPLLLKKTSETFLDWPLDAIEALVAAATLVAYRRGEYVCHAGDRSTWCAFVGRGTLEEAAMRPRAELLAAGRAGKVKAKTVENGVIVRHHNVGDFFGADALLTREPRTTSVRCATDAELFVCTREAFVLAASCLPRLTFDVLARRATERRHADLLAVAPLSHARLRQGFTEAQKGTLAEPVFGDWTAPALDALVAAGSLVLRRARDVLFAAPHDAAAQAELVAAASDPLSGGPKRPERGFTTTFDAFGNECAGGAGDGGANAVDAVARAMIGDRDDPPAYFILTGNIIVDPPYRGRRVFGPGDWVAEEDIVAPPAGAITSTAARAYSNGDDGGGGGEWGGRQFTARCASSCDLLRLPRSAYAAVALEHATCALASRQVAARRRAARVAKPAETPKALLHDPVVRFLFPPSVVDFAWSIATPRVVLQGDPLCATWDPATALIFVSHGTMRERVGRELQPLVGGSATLAKSFGAVGGSGDVAFRRERAIEVDDFSSGVVFGATEIGLLRSTFVSAVRCTSETIAWQMDRREIEAFVQRNHPLVFSALLHRDTGEAVRLAFNAGAMAVLDDSPVAPRLSVLRQQ